MFAGRRAMATPHLQGLGDPPALRYLQGAAMPSSNATITSIHTTVLPAIIQPMFAPLMLQFIGMPPSAAWTVIRLRPVR